MPQHVQPGVTSATRRRMQGACVRNEPDGLRLSARWAAAADLGSGGLASLRLAASAIAAAKPKMGLAFDPPVCVPVEPMRCRRRHSWREETSALRRNGESPSHLVPPSMLTGRCAPALMRATGRVGHSLLFRTALQSGGHTSGRSCSVHSMRRLYWIGDNRSERRVGGSSAHLRRAQRYGCLHSGVSMARALLLPCS